MKVNSSEYLRKVKPVLVKLRDRLLQEYPYASILAQDSVTKNYLALKHITIYYRQHLHPLIQTLRSQRLWKQIYSP